MSCRTVLTRPWAWGISVLAIAALALVASRGNSPPESATHVDPELARLVRQLQARDSFYRRVVCRWIKRAAPAVAATLPRLFNPRTGRADRRRLEAHDALVGLGERARPALPLLAEAFASDDAVVRTYTLGVVAHLNPDAREFMAMVPTRADPFDRAVRHLGGVLRDEDERVRDFAWRCLETCSRAAHSARTAIVAVRDDPAAEAELRARAERTLHARE